MAERIVASVRRMREVVEAEAVQDDLHSLVARYARAQLYRQAGPQTEKLRREIVGLLAKKYFPAARRAGIEASGPVLDAMGGRSLVARGSALRGGVLASFKRYHRSNLAVLEAGLRQEIGGLTAEIDLAFSRAARDGVARKTLIADLVAADRGELRQIARARKRLRAAISRLGSAEESGDTALIRKARKEVRLSKQSVRATRSFYARFEVRVQGHARDAVRREAQRAQFYAFQQAGFTETFTWVSVNGSDACPSCIELHGQTKTAAGWRGQQPGDGQTLCGESCMCQLIPNEYTRDNETLRQPVNPYT